MKLFSYFKKQFITCLAFCSMAAVTAQTKQVQGTVLDEYEVPLMGASVVVQGTDQGTVTDFDGLFSIEIETTVTIQVSYVGYSTQDIQVRPGDDIVVNLKPSNALQEVVLTALGLKRAEKALGYSVQGIKASELAQVKNPNVVNSLAGKVAGVNVTGSAAGPAASSNITIRGASSLMGNNQPLFIVNGMPITNDLYTFDNGLNGSSSIDFGNAAQLINADDIENISVLKGPAAAALYGSRAANGVILIETKTGSSDNQGFGVSLNTSLTLGSPLKLPDYQNEYGSGGGGKYSYLNGSTYIGANENYDAYGENWGPRMNGQLIKQFNSNGEAVPFTPAPNNVRDFYNTAVTSITNIAVNQENSKGQSRFSYTHMNNTGLIPNTDLKRNTFQTSLTRKFFNDKARLRFNNMFVRSTSGNIPNSGYDESSSVMYGWLWLPRQVEINDLKDYWQPGLEGVEQRYAENLWVNNPWFIANENTNAFQSNRIISNVQLDYEIHPMLDFRMRYGVDYVDEQRQYKRAPSTKGVLNGSYREDEISFMESNAEALFQFNPTPKEANLIDIDVKAGMNFMQQQANFLVANNPELQIFGTDPSVYTLSNARSGVLLESQKTNTKIYSGFALASFDFNNLVYVDLSYRNDWTSTLVNPAVGRENSDYSIGYPSAATSVLLSDIFSLPASVDLLKFRASYAEVGNGAPAYSFGNSYTPQAPYGNNPVFTTTAAISDPNLKNERTTATEFGIDLRLFDNRAKFDITYYSMRSFDQIISLPVAKSSGYDFTLTNGGEITNKGLELALDFEVLRGEGLQWRSRVNYGRNRARVAKLPEVIGSGRYAIVADVFPGDEGGSDLELVAEEGELLGQLYGLGFQRDSQGNIIHENGLPLHTQEKVSAGTYQPDFRVGWYNSFNYKNLSLSFLFDGQVGGKIYSRSHALYATAGTITNNDDPNLDMSTLDGRTVYGVDYDSSGNPVYTLEQQGGVVGPGVMYDGSGNLVPNTVEVPAGGAGYTGYFYNYYGNGFNRDNIEAATYDATYFKLRTLSLGFNMPKSLAQSWGFQAASLSLIGNNLLLFTQVPSVDPETFSIRNGVFVNGFESTAIPSQRSIGLNLNLKF